MGGGSTRSPPEENSSTRWTCKLLELELELQQQLQVELELELELQVELELESELQQQLQQALWGNDSGSAKKGSGCLVSVLSARIFNDANVLKEPKSSCRHWQK